MGVRCGSRPRGDSASGIGVLARYWYSAADNYFSLGVLKNGKAIQGSGSGERGGADL